MKTDQRGLIITTSSFTRDVYKEALAESKTPISLVDGQRLLDLLFEFGIGVIKKEIPYFELDADRLEEFDAGGETGEGGQYLGLWPLPGGMDKFVESGVKILRYIAQSEPTRRQVIDWMKTKFKTVKSDNTSWAYVNVLKVLGMVVVEGETVMINEIGSRAFKGDSRDLFLEQLKTRVVGISRLLIRLEQQPLTIDEAHAQLKDEISADWKTTAQTKWRLQWLENVGAIKKKGDKYYLV